ncbi:uncharacterized protein (DUF433 family) [Rhodoligotrophos appendicifer]
MMRAAFIAAWLRSAQAIPTEQLFAELLKQFPSITAEEYAEAIDLSHRERDRRVHDHSPG